MKRYILLLLIVIVKTGYLSAGGRHGERNEYIKRYSEVAITEMNLFHIPASIKLAQGCLESGNGKSTLSKKANNHFGIKCGGSWTGPYVAHDDDAKAECFRKYNSAWESYRDHSEFLTKNQRYSSLFELDITDYKGWAYELKKAGYATDKKYPEKLISIIEDNKLYVFDLHYGEKVVDSRKGAGAYDYQINSLFQERQIELRNKRKSFVSKDGDTYENIATEFGMKKWEIDRYNDLKYNSVKGGKLPGSNSVVFIAPKRGKAPKGYDYHIFQDQQTMWSVSQQYGIRLRSLYRKNRMQIGDEPEPGQKLWLRKKKPLDLM